MPDDKRQSPLCPRLERIYRFLCEETDLLPAHAVLPSIRKIKLRFSLGQEAATAICKRLAERYGVTRQPKKQKKQSGSGREKSSTSSRRASAD